MRAECFTTDIYCDAKGCRRKDNTGGAVQTRRESHRELRSRGWQIGEPTAAMSMLRPDLCDEHHRDRRNQKPVELKPRE